MAGRQGPGSRGSSGRGKGGPKGNRKAPAGRKAGTDPRGLRAGAAKLKTARGRRLSSALWLQRQLKDPYVIAARRDGLRSRAAFKLMQIDDKYGFLRPGLRVLDLGAAPGGWTQVAVDRVRAGQPGGGRVVGIDLQEMDPVAGADLISLDFLDPSAPERLKALLDGPVDVVLSDMAAPSIGHAQTDHLRIMALLEAAYDFARDVLSEGGTFVGKVLRGGAESTFLDQLKRDFAEVRHFKPAASRQESAEIYVVALGFRRAVD